MKDIADINNIREGFNSFYNENLKPLCDGMEKTRLKHLKSYKIRLWLVVALFVGLTGFYYSEILAFISMLDGESAENLLKFVAIVIAGVVAFVARPVYHYKKHTKGDFFPVFIKYFGNFSHQFGHHISEDALNKSLVMPSITRIKPDDYFEGVYKDVNICVSELTIVTGSGKHATSHPRLCILLSMNKSFAGQTFTIKDSGFLNSLNKRAGFENVKLEDPVFEKVWEIYSDNQVEARYLLTTAFMERVLKVKDMYKGRSIQFSFFENNLLLAIEKQGDMFETGSLFKPSNDQTHIFEALEQMLSVLSIVELLKLNQKIGM